MVTPQNITASFLSLYTFSGTLTLPIYKKMALASVTLINRLE
jgi:hypothetical protein